MLCLQNITIEPFIINDFHSTSCSIDLTPNNFIRAMFYNPLYHMLLFCFSYL